MHELFHCFRHSQSSIYAVHLHYPSSTLICGPLWPLNLQNHNILYMDMNKKILFINLKTSGKLMSLNSVYAVVWACPRRKGCVKEIPVILWMNNPVLCKQIIHCFVQFSWLYSHRCAHTCEHVLTCTHTNTQSSQMGLQSPYRNKHTKIHLSALGDISGRGIVQVRSHTVHTVTCIQLGT